MAQFDGEAGEAAGPGARTARLWAEFLLLYVGAPLLVAFELGARAAFPALGITAAIGAALLAATPGFEWRELLARPRWSPGRSVALTLVFAALCAAAILPATLLLAEERLFRFPLYAFEMWLGILFFYAVISVPPQALLFRALFFRRYAGLFGGPGALAIAVNAAVFSLAHLFYWNPVALVMTAIGGAAFAWAHVRSGSFLLSSLWHALAGGLIFTIGLGGFFYTGFAPQ